MKTNKKHFYRVCNPATEQGLWNNFDGTFTGLIHERFDFCANSKLAMDFDEEIVGWLSATQNLEDLWKWFTREDVMRLQNHGWFIHVYEATSWKFYDKFQHYVICQQTSKIIERIDYLKCYE
jgi:hypothetical protein